ncbi:MAG: hypothetical protein U0575_10900 [Phycisphaerales bacterium]
MMDRARGYAARHGLELRDRLGFGKDGTVWLTNERSAVKALRHAEPYQREVAAYRRLSRLGVVEVNGLFVPQFIRSDDELLVFEMTIVQPPFILDFASAYLDNDAPVFPSDVYQEWRERLAEEFDDDWPRARLVLARLAGMGVHVLDPHPRNMDFGRAGGAGGTDGAGEAGGSGEAGAAGGAGGARDA